MSVPSGRQQQDDLLRLFFSSTAATSATTAPAPIVSPYPASSYTRFLRPPAADASSSTDEHKEQTTFLSSPPSSLFSARPVLSPYAAKKREESARKQQRHRTAPVRTAGSGWNKPLQKSLHLPILRDILAPASAQQPPPSAASIVTLATASSASPSSASPPPLSAALSRVYAQSSSYEQSLQLRTSDDAIAFFSRMGSSSPVKFVYANRALPATASAYQPYELTVVDRKHINPSEYFTISTHGIVAITASAAAGSESESTTLADWVHQSSMFTLLRSIRFFKHYLVSKLFRLWKANVRYRIFEQQRRRVAQSLFLARPSFCGALLAIGEVMGDIRQVPLCQVRPGVVYSSESFGKEQGEARAIAVKRVEGCVERVEDVLEAVCKGVKDRARLYDHRIANEELSNSRFAQHLLGDAGAGLGAAGGGGKVKSMVQQKEEKRVRLLQLHHANREADMLGDFIRLIDYIEVETLVGKCIDNTAEFLALLLNTAKPLFTTAVSFAPSSPSPSAAEPSLLFTPTAVDITALLTSISSSTISSVDGLSRIISHRKFLPLLRSGDVPSDSLKVTVIVHDDRCYSSMMREMEARVESGFVGVNDSVRFLERHRVVWEYGERIKEQQQSGVDNDTLQDDGIAPAAGSAAAASANNPLPLPSPSAASPSSGATYAAAAAASSSPTPISSLTQTLTGLSRWSTSLQHIRDLYSSGLIQADCRSLKLTLLPITEAAIQRKRRRMVQLFNEGVEHVMLEYGAMQAALRDEPVMLSQYVDYVRLVADVKQRERTLRSGLVAELAGLQRLMLDTDMYNSSQWVATSEQVRYDEMSDSVQSFQDAALRDAEQRIESKWEEMKGKLMQEIKRFEQSIEQLNRQTDDNPLYTDYSAWGGVGAAGLSAVKEVLASLEQDGRRWRELQKRTEEMQRQQLVLEDTQHVFKGLQLLIDKHERKRAFFTAVESWKEREKRFWLGDLDKADLLAVTAELTAMDAAITAYTNAVKHNQTALSGSGTTRESERTSEALKRDLELIKSFRVDLGFYGGFIAVVRDLQWLLGRLGTETYKATFVAFGHLKRMKDIKKIDWTLHKPTIAAKLDELRGAAAVSGGAAAGDSEAAAAKP